MFSNFYFWNNDKRDKCNNIQNYDSTGLQKTSHESEKGTFLLPLLGSISFEGESVKRNIEVTYYKPIDMLGDFGGVASVVTMIIGLLVHMFSSS